MNELYRFYNPRASSVRSLMVANCVELENSLEDENSRQSTNSKEKVGLPGTSSSSRDVRTGNPLSNLPQEQRELIDRGLSFQAPQRSLQGGFQSWKPFDNVSDISYSNQYCSGTSDRGSSSHHQSPALSPVSDFDSGDNSIEDTSEGMDQSASEETEQCSTSSTSKRSKPQKRQRDQRGKLLVLDNPKKLEKKRIGVGNVIMYHFS